MSLAVLSRRFFTAHSPTSDLYQKWRESYAWNENIVPVYEWDSILYIGVTAEQSLHFDFPFVQVICDPLDLKTVWNSFQMSSASSRQDDKSGDPFAAIESSITYGKLNDSGTPADLLQADSSEEPSLENTHDEEHSQMTVEAVQDDAPGGLIADIPSPKLSFSMPDSPVMKAPEPEAAPVVLQQEEKTQKIEVAVKKVEVATPIKPISNAVKPAAVASTASSPQPPPPPVREVTVSQIARSTDTFSQMHNYFQKSMILKVDGKTVKPWKWDDRFKPATQTSEMNLDTPSPFRIVNRTAKPYHGYISPNELNEKFFQEWNNNEIPDHLTLAPVIVDDHVVAMLMGIGDKASDNKLSLQHAEKIAMKLSVEMKQAAAKAA